MDNHREQQAPSGDVSKIEIVTDKSDYEPAKGKPIIKIIWDDKTKSVITVFDPAVFPTLNFVEMLCRSVADTLQQQVKMSMELNFGQQVQKNMMEQQQAAQLAQSLRGNGRGR